MVKFTDDIDAYIKYFGGTYDLVSYPDPDYPEKKLEIPESDTKNWKSKSTTFHDWKYDPDANLTYDAQALAHLNKGQAMAIPYMIQLRNDRGSDHMNKDLEKEHGKFFMDIGFKFPDTGEFKYYRDHSAIVNQYPDDPTDFIGNVNPWRTINIVRTDFTGKPIDCCLANSNVVNGRTCEEKHAKARGGACRDLLHNYCSHGDRILSEKGCLRYIDYAQSQGNKLANMYCENNFDDKRCHNWAINNTQYGPALLQSYCSGDNANKQVCLDYANSIAGPTERRRVLRARCKNNMHDPTCQQWARRQTPQQKVRYTDSIVKKYCDQEGKSDIFCTCINLDVSEKQIAKGIINPHCFAKECKGERLSYIPGAWQRLNCPRSISCNQAIKLNNSKAMTIDVDDLEQGCYIHNGVVYDDKQKRDYSGPSAPVAPPQHRADATGSTDIKTDWVMIFLVLIIIAVIISAITLIVGIVIYIT